MHEKRERLVETIICLHSSSGESGVWFLLDAWVDFDLPLSEAKEAALESAHEQMKDNDNVAHIGIYSVWHDSLMYEFWSDLDDDKDNNDEYEC